MKKKLEVNSKLAAFRKYNALANILKAVELENISIYENYQHIYTDDSKNENGVGAAAVMGDKVKGSTLPKVSSIFTAELQAINLAIAIVEETPFTRYAVFSDSISALSQLRTGNTNNHLVQRLLVRLCNLRQRGKEIVFCWIPSHVGIEGNERMDTAATQAADRSAQFILVPYQD